MKDAPYLKIGTYAQHILAHDGMSIGSMLKIASKWDRWTVFLRMYFVEFDIDGNPNEFSEFRIYPSLHDKDRFVGDMAKTSLTHRVMFVDNTGSIFLARSSDGKTNIDAGMIEAFTNGFRGQEN